MLRHGHVFRQGFVAVLHVESTIVPCGVVSADVSVIHLHSFFFFAFSFIKRCSKYVKSINK